MDGPDVWYCYWRDFKKDEKHLCRRDTGGCAVMVWATFSNFGQVGLTFCFLKMDQDEYTQALEQRFPKWVSHHFGVSRTTRKCVAKSSSKKNKKSRYLKKFYKNFYNLRISKFKR